MLGHLCAWTLVVAGPAVGQELTVTGQAELLTKANVAVKNRSNVVVWLNPIGDTTRPTAPRSPAGPVRLVQKNKRFEPRILVVPAGTPVEFPIAILFSTMYFHCSRGSVLILGYMRRAQREPCASIILA